MMKSAPAGRRMSPNCASIAAAAAEKVHDTYRTAGLEFFAGSSGAPSIQEPGLSCSL